MMAPPTVDRLGVDLRVGDIIVQALPDESYAIHRIGRLAEYPGRYLSTVHRDPDHPRRIRRATVESGHARIAYGTGDTPRWRLTAADCEVFHVLSEFKRPTAPPTIGFDQYLPPPCDRLVWPEPIRDPALPAVTS
jgi:hypothetical protein